MGYHNWFHEYFKKKHNGSEVEEVLDDIFLLLENRGREYLEHNKEVYSQLYIEKDEDILSSKPQIIQQVREELYYFLKVLIENKVKRVLQIGLGHFGSTQFCLSLICDKVVTVEYDMSNISNYADRELLYNQNIETFIHGDSSDDEVIRRVYDFNDFDCLFIDGNHSYDYVKNDYDNYYRSIRKGGVIAFHDAFMDGDRYGTPKVLGEIIEFGHIDLKYIKHSKEVGIAYFIK